MIERHGDGIAAFGKPENKVVLRFVDGVNNAIRVIQRRAYGLRDEEYTPHGPHLHAPKYVKSCRNHPLEKENTHEDP